MFNPLNQTSDRNQPENAGNENMNANLHPKKRLISRGEMAAIIAGGNFLCQRKYDGVLARRTFENVTLLGELVTARSGAFLTPADRALIAAHGSFFAAFTVETVDSENVLPVSTTIRSCVLNGLAERFPADIIQAETVTDIDAAMQSGAEGVCAHSWGDSWGEMLAHKANSIYVCRVASVGNSQSVGIVDAATGEARGNLKLGGGKADRVRVGSVIRCEGMGLTDKGLIRQPVACREWLVTF